MKTIPVILPFFLQVIFLSAFCQNQNIKFEHLDDNEGMPQKTVLCILQDRQGFIWVATTNGLNKYDGYKFTVYKNDPKNKNSISGDFIQDIAESKNGDLWIATLGGGLSKYDRQHDKFINFKHDPVDSNSVSMNSVNSVQVDREGKVWIGTPYGLDVFDPQKNIFTHYRYDSTNKKSISNDHIKCLFEDSQGNLWIGTAYGGLNLFNREQQTFTRFEHNTDDNKTISSNHVSAIFEDSKHRLWVGTYGDGFDLFDKGGAAFYHFKHKAKDRTDPASNYVLSIGEDNDKHIWIGTENGGLIIFDPEKATRQTVQYDEFDPTGISGNCIYSIYNDAKGNMWLGLFTAGIEKVSRDVDKFIHYKHKPLKNSLSFNNVLSIFEDSKKNMWIGTDGGGVNMFNPGTGKFTHFRHQVNNKNSICGDYVLTVGEDSQGNMWFGTWGDGVTVYNPVKNTFTHYRNDPFDSTSLSLNHAWTILEDSDKNIWIGTYGGGLNRFNPGKKDFTHYNWDEKSGTKPGTLQKGINNNFINALSEDSYGNICISTDGGLNLFNKKTKIFSHFVPSENRNSISSTNVYCTYEDQSKNLWMSTGQGLNFLDRKTNQFTVYTTADGLPSNLLFGILEDGKDNLWISTDAGISRFNTVTKKFTNFTKEDGLQSNVFREQAYCKGSSGVMYFGGINGFNEFRPGDIKLVSFDPPIVITNFQIFNKNVSIATTENDPSPLKRNITETQAITLSYKNSVFSFEFASLNYVHPRNKKYAYMMEEFDKTWNEVGNQQTATYTNLDPGKYVFKVKGVDNQGRWSSKEAKIILTITPPFWLTWWFKLTAFILLTGTVVAIYYFRVKIKFNLVQSQKKELQIQVEQQTIQLVRLNGEERKARFEAEKAHAESEITRQTIDRTNKELERKNKELEQFTYVASHDLQEPLRTTSGIVELLHKQYIGKLDEKADKYLTFILQSTNRMKLLIQNLLEYSLIGRKKELDEVDCNSLLQHVLADMGRAISESKAEVTAGYLPTISGYPTELKQLFQNLISNAIKFRKVGVAPQITISAIRKDNCWEFAFQDDGIGMEKEHNEKIFVIFQRLHTLTEYKGSGIGLAHCKKIVELHHGTIWVQSAPGQGSTFYFTIPQNNSAPHEKKIELQTAL